MNNLELPMRVTTPRLKYPARVPEPVGRGLSGIGALARVVGTRERLYSVAPGSAAGAATDEAGGGCLRRQREAVGA